MPARDVLRPLVAGPLIALLVAGCGVAGGEPPTVRATPVEEVTPGAGGPAAYDDAGGTAGADARDDQQDVADDTAAPSPGESMAAPGPPPGPACGCPTACWRTCVPSSGASPTCPSS